MIENSKYVEKLQHLRNNFKYSYIVQWIYLLKHLIKLVDAFDVENLEEELLGLAPPIFLNSLKSKLILYLRNQKLVNVQLEFDFFVDQIYKDYDLIPPGHQNNNDTQTESEKNTNDDNDNDHKNDNNDDDNDDTDKPLITYSSLSLDHKIEVLYVLIKFANSKSFANLRKNADKFESPQLALKIYPLYTIDKADGIREEFIILQDARLYLKTIKFNKFEIPQKLSDYNKEINDENKFDYFQSLEPKIVDWKCLASGIYQFDDYVKSLKNSFGRKYSSDEFKLSKILEENIDFIIDHDLKKRKQSAQRKREIEMQSLMANRKRSSRLEEKEKRKREEEAVRLEELEILKKNAAEMRAAKRMKLKETSLVSREERLKKRHGDDSNNTNETADTTNDIIPTTNDISMTEPIFETPNETISQDTPLIIDQQLPENEIAVNHNGINPPISQEIVETPITQQESIELPINQSIPVGTNVKPEPQAQQPAVPQLEETQPLNIE